MKTNENLGLEVRKHLIHLGIETPMDVELTHNKAKLEEIRYNFEVIMKTLGLDLTDDSLKDTPNRVAKMYVEEFFKGLDYKNFPKCTAVENKMKADEMVVIDKIAIKSVCEHHLVGIIGEAKIAYIPKDKILGLSKFNRVSDFFSRRPQIQERLTSQIAEALKYILKTEDVAIVIKATHHCVKCRGVQDENSITTTSKMSGVFKTKAEARNEFLNL